MLLRRVHCFFFFNDTATTEIYTLSLHDALPISYVDRAKLELARGDAKTALVDLEHARSIDPNSSSIAYLDRKSTRLNSSHGYISYAVFCLKKKTHTRRRMPASSLHTVRI